MCKQLNLLSISSKQSHVNSAICSVALRPRLRGLASLGRGGPVWYEVTQVNTFLVCRVFTCVRTATKPTLGGILNAYLYGSSQLSSRAAAPTFVASASPLWELNSKLAHVCNPVSFYFTFLSLHLAWRRAQGKKGFSLLEQHEAQDSGTCDECFQRRGGNENESHDQEIMARGQKRTFPGLAW